ncbi:MAG: putative Ig domain-containing protein [Acidobacteriota bacterium]|nr:putative Ig domain-containing protein [Acidobacteriota bacterium]
MRLTFPRINGRHSRLIIATTIALALAATHAAAQFGSFGSAYEGELWGVRSEVTLPDEGEAGGIAYVGGMLFVADRTNETVIAFDGTGAVVPIAGAEWEGFVPGEIAGAKVSVDGADTTALLVSDAGAHRVLAFDLDGQHLFTMQLERPGQDAFGVGYPGAPGGIYGMAMGPDARFVLTTLGTPTLALENSFAAAWSNQYESDGAVLAYRNLATIPYNGTDFLPVPTAVLNGVVAGNLVTRPGQVVYSLVFDPLGNLYTIDTNTERLNVYGDTFTHRFVFGTPAVDGTLEEFEQPYGIVYSPDDGGRLFIGDSDHFRVQIYKPNLANNTLDYVSTIAAFGADGLPRSLALDAATGKLAVSNLWAGNVWILDRPALAAFDLQVLDAVGSPLEDVCAGDPYRVRFSLTVPAGRALVSDIEPELAINDIPVGATPTPVPSAVQLTAGQVVTYTYDLVMPSTVSSAPYRLTAGASASTADVLVREALLQGVNCSGAAPTIEAFPSIPPQVSGWTPVRPGETFELRFEASDAEGVAAIEYQITGQNNPGTILDPVPNPVEGTTQTLVLPLPEFGFSTVRYRAIDTDNRKSSWQTFNLRSVLVQDKVSVESDSVAFAVGYPIGVGYRFSAAGLPPGVQIDDTTGQISGDLSWESAGEYDVVVTEDTGLNTPSSSVGFHWTIANVNRHPLIQQLGSISVTEGEPFSIQVEASDPDGDPVWYSLIGVGNTLPSGITINPTTGLISGTFPFDSRRDYTIQIGVSECGALAPPGVCSVVLPGSRLATVVNSSIEVINVNRPPEIINPGGRSNAEADVISLPIVASDPDIATDGQVLTYRAQNLPPGLSIDPGTGVISGTIGYNALPSYAVTIEVDDAETVPTQFVVFTWLISNVNRPPTASAENRTDAENATVSFGITSDDPDDDTLTYSATGLPAGISIDPTTGVISGTLGYTTAGEYDVVVTVSDGSLTATALFQWSVTNTNAPPAITNPGNQSDLEGETVSVQIVASDVDGQALTYSASGLPPGLTIDSTGLITGLLSYATAGSYPAATVTVSDGVTSRSVTFTWTVTNVNRPPMVTNPGTQNSAEGATLSLPISASDPDGEALTYSSTGLPPGLSINSSSGVISGTLTYAAAGTYSVTVRASDGSLFDEETFTWHVSDTVPTNQPPVCSATASAGDLWPPNHKPSYLSLTGITDPDGDQITIRYTGILQDEPVDSVGQGNTPDFDGGIEDDGARAWIRSERTGNPNVPGDGRVYLISYTATDEAGASCSGTTSLGVPHDQRGTPAVLSPGRWNSLNGQQIYAPPPDAVNDVASVERGKAVTIAVLGNDSLTLQPVVVTIVGAPSMGTATTNGQTITYTAPSTTGSATLTYRVTGPFGTDTATVTIAIK